MQNEDPRQARSRRALIDAAARLLDRAESTDSGDFSVTDVVREAGVSRPTFYQHFGDVNTLIRATALMRLEATFGRVVPVTTGESWTAFMRGTIRMLLEDLQTHDGFFRHALHSGAGPALSADFTEFLADRFLEVSPLAPILRRRPGPDTPRDRAELLGAGAVWHVVRWIEADAARRAPIDEVAERLSALLLGASGATDAEIAAATTETPLLADTAHHTTRNTTKAAR